VQGKSGTVTLRGASQADCLILQEEEGGERTSLFASFYERPVATELRKVLDLRMLQLNGDLDALGSMRITLSQDLTQYMLCEGTLQGQGQEDFIAYLQAVLNTVTYLRRELKDIEQQWLTDRETDAATEDKQAHYIQA
jgi:hypothetical protein